MPPDVCAPCTEELNDNYTLGTGDLYLCGADGITRSVGNVRLLDLVYTPNSVEHRRGKDGSFDAEIPLSEDFALVVTLDELTPQNLAWLFGQDLIHHTDGCEVPLSRVQCLREFAAQFIHTFRCATKTLQIDIWRASIRPLETTISFGEEIVNWPMTIRAKSCVSIHPSNPYGRLLFNETCPVS